MDIKFKDVKYYKQIKDHLGNVRTVISDVKNPEAMTGQIEDWQYLADIRNISNLYPYGKSLGGDANYSVDEDYGYGFNGMEKEKPLDEGGDAYDFGARVYRDGRFYSRDPRERDYPGISSYVFAANNPIAAIDPDGEAVLFVNGWYWNGTFGLGLFGDGSGGKKSYWGGFADDFMEKTGDYKAYYIDGSLGGSANTASYAPGVLLGPYSTAASAIAVSDFSNVSAETRREAGYDWAINNAEEIISNLKPVEGTEFIESIKVVTHSMGTGFSRGMIEGFQEEADRLGVKLTFETLLDVESFQAADFPAPLLPSSETQKLFKNNIFKIAEQNGSWLPTIGPIKGSERAGDYPNAGHSIQDFDAEDVPESNLNSDERSTKEYKNNNKGG